MLPYEALGEFVIVTLQIDTLNHELLLSNLLVYAGSDSNY